jgi:hypothetical protein
MMVIITMENEMKHHEYCDLMEPASFGSMGNKCTCGALALAGALSGIDGVDSLLSEAGYKEDSSTRHQLSIVRSMLAELKPNGE